MVPKTVQIECPNGVKTKTRKKHVPKSTKIGKVSKNVPTNDSQTMTDPILFLSFFCIGALWAPTWPPEPPTEAQGSLQEAIWSHFCSNFHPCSTHLCPNFLKILSSIFRCFFYSSKQTNEQTNTQTHTHSHANRQTNNAFLSSRQQY